MTTEQLLLGVGLTLSLAVGSQILVSRLRIPALIVLLPVGFVAGALTEVVNPNQLLGPLFEPLVSLAVAVILFDSGLGLDLSRLQGRTRRVVRRLIVIGVPVTWAISATLVANGIGGADDILPVTFLVIVVTVTLYGLTAAPAARLLGDEITKAGLELAPGELLAAATSRGAELEGVTAVLLLTGEDDFNALASTTLRSNLEGAVYRVPAPRDSHGVVAPYTGAEVLFGNPLTGFAIDQRHHHGAAIVTRPAEDAVPDGYDLLFLIRPDGQLVAVTRHRRPAPEDGDTLVLLGPARHPANASPTSGD